MTGRAQIQTMQNLSEIDVKRASGTTEMYLLELIESGTLQGMRASQHNQDFKSLAMPYVMEHHD